MVEAESKNFEGIIQKVEITEIMRLVSESVGSAQKYIIATMLLAEEIDSPLPTSYHNLLSEKIKQGVALLRLGFGSEEEFGKVQEMYQFNTGGYDFKLCVDCKKYQRMIIIDGKMLFFGIDGNFYQSSYQPLVNAFKEYFSSLF